MRRSLFVMAVVLAASCRQPASAGRTPSARDSGADVLDVGEPGSPRREFLRAAFAYAEAVISARVGVKDAVVLEELRGFKIARRVPLLELPANDPRVGPGRDILVAGTTCQGASPALCAIAWLPDTKDNRRLLDEWAIPAWTYAPIVAVVKIAEAPDTRKELAGGRVVFEVVRVLKGDVPSERLIDNAWDFEKFRPLSAGAQEYVLSAWGISKIAEVRYPMPWVHALTPIDEMGIAQVERDLVRDSRAKLIRTEASAREAIKELKRAWTFHEASMVAETTVGVAYGEPTNCGSWWFTLVPNEWFRGQTQALATELNGPFLPVADAKKPSPFLFLAGGHCYQGPERPGMSYLAAGLEVGKAPLVWLESSPTARNQVARYVAAGEPRFAARPVSKETPLTAQSVPKTPALTAGDADFEPPLVLEGLASELGLSVTRFEVVARDSVQTDGGFEYGWIRCRTLASEPGVVQEEWVFEGGDLPHWSVGSQLAGHWIEAFHSTDTNSLSRRHALFLPGLFVPADAKLDHLRQAMRPLFESPRQ